MIIFHEVAAFHYCQGQSQGALKKTNLHENNKLNVVYCPTSLPEFSAMRNRWVRQVGGNPGNEFA